MRQVALKQMQHRLAHAAEHRAAVMQFIQEIIYSITLLNTLKTNLK